MAELKTHSGGCHCGAVRFEVDLPDEPLMVRFDGRLMGQALTNVVKNATEAVAAVPAESLGKGGNGTTPVAAVGPVDQHSQLQLFLDGPADKLVTLIMRDTRGEGPELPADLAVRAGEKGFAGRHVGDFVWAQQRATADTLARNGRPVRTFLLDRIDSLTIGELLMHFMLETIIAADLLGIDAFDQPAVEEGKILAKQYLAED